MTRTPEGLFSAALGLLALGACGGSGGTAVDGTGPPDDPPVPKSTTMNFELAALEIDGAGDHWIVAVSEEDQGGRDLNADGDATDAVYHALDLETRTLTNLGIAASGRPPAVGDLVPPPTTRVEGSLAALFVDELLQGGNDLNDDGDAEDTILYFHDFADGEFQNTGLSVVAFGRRGLDMDGDLAAFVVSEAAQGNTDLDGDGFARALVLHVRDTTGTIRNTRNAALPTLKIANGHVGFFAPEFDADLNGDGDRSDFSVFHVYDFERDRVVNSGLAGDLGTVFALGDTWVILVSESDQGRTDLNGDGDFGDLVFHAFDAATGVVHNLGVSSRRGFFSAQGGTRMLLPIEEDSMQSDLNADGDIEDVVIFTYETTAHALRNTGLATRGFGDDQFLLDCAIGIVVSEAANGGQDLNRDGDAADRVFHSFDAATGITNNEGFCALEFRSSGRYLLFLESEVLIDADLNGDGDRDDPVLSLWNSCTDELTPTAWTSTGTIDTNGSGALVATFEGSANRDLNGDGDAQDSVLTFIDLETKKIHELGFAFVQAHLVSPHEALVLVSEEQEDEDLNADGDRRDAVLFVVDLVTPAR